MYPAKGRFTEYSTTRDITQTFPCTQLKVGLLNIVQQEIYANLSMYPAKGMCTEYTTIRDITQISVCTQLKVGLLNIL